MKKFTFFLLSSIIIASVVSAQVPIISFENNWKYLDNGSNQGTAWKSLSFDDASWKTGNGKFGHGISDANTVISYGSNASQKYITTYFRKTVNIDPSAYTSFTANIKRDDGAIMYVNGVEVFRNKMPSGTPTYTTPASSTADKGVTPVTFTIKKSAFTSGTNVIAVEVHIEKPTSPEMAFALEVKGNGTTPPQTPPAPLLTSPANSSSNVSPNPLLSWSAAAGATKYRVEVSESSTFATTFFAQNDITTTSVQVSNLLQNKVYYWRVRASNSVGDGAWSAVWSFTTASPTTPPAAPVLLTPANAATEIPTSTALNWNTASGATKYRAEVSEIVTFATTFFTRSDITATSVQVSNLLPNKVYYWRVRAANSTGGEGDWSTVWSFTTATVASGGLISFGDPWKYLDNGSNQGTAWKSLSFDDASWKTGNGKFGHGISDTSTTISYGPNASQKYITTYFRKTVNIDLSAYTSFTASIKRDDGAIVYVNGVEVLRNKMPSGTPTYTTPASSTADKGVTPLSFTIKKSAFTSGINVIAVEVHIEKPTSPEMAFDLEVKGNGTTTPPQVPPAPLLTSPANSSSNISPNPLLSWSAAAGATKYRAEVSESSTFATTFFAQNDITTTSVQVSNLLQNKVYYWRVRASNSVGDGAWSAVWSFTTAPPTTPPAAPVLLTPANAATEIPTSTALNWNTAAGATKYSVEVSESQTFSTTFFTQNDITATSVQVSNLLPNKVYYWRVRGANSGGDGDWSAVWSFTTAPPAAPTAPVLLTPANAATDIPTSTSLIWNAPSGATKYSVEVSESQTFSTTFFSQSDITTTTIQVSNLLQSKVYYWRVRAGNDGGYGNWSTVWSFTTTSPPVQTLFHYWNFNNTTDLLTPTLTLNGGSLSTDVAASSATLSGTGQEFNGSNARNGDLAEAHFRLNIPIGSTLTFNISTVGFDEIIFKYETRRSATGSEIQKISYSLDGTSFIFLQNHNVINGIPSLVTINLAAISGASNNPNLKIRIQFEQGAGTADGGNNRFDNVTVEGHSQGGGVSIPGQVQTTSPANNQQAVPLRPDFSWQATPNATTYKIQVATDNQFAALAAEKTLPAQTTYKLESALSVATNYFWRVRAVNSAGEGPWSEVKTFTTINQVIVYKLAVNEMMSSNTTVVTDDDGSFQDWIELVNYGTTSINLQGFGLTDAAATPFKWVFPAKVLGPGQFLMVWASNKNRVDPTKPLHTNFAISAQGEDIVLTAPDGETIDKIPAVVIPANTSRGHQPDGAGPLKYFNTPTPGAANTGGVDEIISNVVFSQAPGVYSANIALALTNSDPAVTIRYTLDGSEPTSTSPIYQQPLQLTDRSGQPNAHSMIPTNNLQNSSRAWTAPNGLVRKGWVIRAKAYKATTESQTVTGSFIVLAGRQYTLPVISVVTPWDSLFSFQKGIYVPGYNYFASDDGSGNYYQKGDNWERAGSIEFYSPDLTFRENLAYRINGDNSRRFPQKSLRLVAKSKYGKSSIDYPVFKNFSNSSFKRLELNNGGNDWGSTMFRDALGSRLVSHILPSEHNRPSIVFINGEYWGIHNIREHTDKYLLARVYGVDAANIDYLTRNLQIEEGEDTNYKEFLSYIQNTDLAVDANFEGIKKRMDVDNYLNYFSSEIYVDNTDWPHSNIEYWRARVNYNPAVQGGLDGRWRWILHDLDGGFFTPQHNSIALITPVINEHEGSEWPNFVLRNLLKNQAFKFEFINRIADHLNTAFIPARVNQIIDSMKTNYQPEMAEHILRWNEPSSVSSWNTKVDAMKSFANLRPANLRQHIKDAFALGNALTVTLDVSDKSHGSIRINSITINSNTVGADAVQPYPWNGTYFGSVPIKLKALANPGFVFDHWLINGTVINTEEVSSTPVANSSVKAFFVATTGVKPVLLSPANAVKNVAKTPATFTWQAVPQATSYRLQVSMVTDFLTTISDQSGLSSTSGSVTGLLDSALYYWRVMAVGANGSSDWSDVRIFTTAPSSTPFPGVVDLTFPANGATHLALNPTVTWSPAANATTYSVQLSPEADFDDLVVNQYNLPTTSFPVTGLLRNTVFYWRVKANNERGSSAWSEVRTFRTAPLVAGSDLVGHWPLNEGAGKDLLDQSGKGNNAILQSFDDIYWVPAVEGLGLSVLGRTNMFGIAPNHSSLNITGNITLAAWIRPQDVASRTIISKTAPDGYELGINSNGKIEFRFNSTTNGNTYRIFSATSYPADGITWTHVTATYDGFASRIYINGILDATVTFATPANIKTNSSGLYIGGLAGSQRWVGVIDDVQLYNRCLSATEIKELVTPQAAAATATRTASLGKTLIAEQTGSLKFYPNPIRDMINLDFKPEFKGKVAITINDVLGRIWLQSNHNLSTNRMAINLTGSKLKPGIYFLVVKTSEFNQVVKFIKE